jgi:hypothetical protein
MNRERANKILTPSSNSFGTIGEELDFLEEQERITAREDCCFCERFKEVTGRCICEEGKISIVRFTNKDFEKRYMEIIDAYVYLDDLESKE